MKLCEIEQNIFTGCVLLVDGTGFVSDLIELFTQGRFSHTAIFFRLDEELTSMVGGEVGDLWVGEMWWGKSFEHHPAHEYLTISDGVYYLAMAPECVYQNQDKVLTEVKRLIREQPRYGLHEFPIILESHLFGLREDPRHILPVCSIAVELCWKPCGVEFRQALADPSDFDEICAGTVEITL